MEWRLERRLAAVDACVEGGGEVCRRQGRRLLLDGEYCRGVVCFDGNVVFRQEAKDAVL